MTDRFEPAFTSEEWAYPLMTITVDAGSASETLAPSDFARNVAALPALIALANAALPVDDPRKITRETVRAILAARTAYPLGSASHRELIQIAAALASYLPADQQPAELAVAYASYLPPEGA